MDTRVPMSNAHGCDRAVYRQSPVPHSLSLRLIKGLHAARPTTATGTCRARHGTLHRSHKALAATGLAAPDSQGNPHNSVFVWQFSREAGKLPLLLGRRESPARERATFPAAETEGLE